MSKEKDTEKRSDVAKREEEILDFWQREKIFQASEEKDAPQGEFVFYDGPPFATGQPHYGHILPGSIKDAIPRYKTMRGYRVRRKWGWDCHGLPLENIVEAELGLKTKKDIEDIGIDVFNKAAADNVMRYADDWKKIIPRMGRWVDMDDAYKTMDAPYTETVWHVFSELHKKGLVTEGFKPMHLCPRCGTTLSNFEVAQGYADIKDFSVTVKLPLNEMENTFLLVWTTTPWTLPGNMAAAVHKDETYVKVELEEGEHVIVGKERIEELLDKKEVSHKVLEEMKGSELVGLSYTPPYPYFLDKSLENKENAWKVWHADYVSMEDGTGAVHIAPAFGAEDMDLAKENSIPIVHHVDMSGQFTAEVTDFAGQNVKPKDDKAAGVDHTDADVEIIKSLAHNGLLFAKEKIEHSYPHCWRCDTPLLNYAASSWFVTVPDLKEKLLEANAKIGWVPKEIGEGRFGNWLEGARDWSISRSRYWGAPIPVWKNPKTQENVLVSSVEQIKALTKTNGNSYLIMRHGESQLNTEETLNATLGVSNPLTSKGRTQVEEAVTKLKDKKIDIIIHSPLQRTKETATQVAKALGLEDSLIEDERITEIAFGPFEGKLVKEYLDFIPTGEDRLDRTPEGGENWTEVRKRAGEFMYDIEAQYQNKNILIVAHNGVLQMLQAAVLGIGRDETAFDIQNDVLDLTNAEVREIDFVPLPHNDRYELDLHRPYIDEIALEKDGEPLERVPDVFDCWFESGSMPYGQHHYPFENTDTFDPENGKGFPADFIAEGLDQTRGWFYSLIVLGVALFGESPYKNVVVNGLILAEDGKKMSKKLKNYPDVMDIVDKYGADALRYYLLSSPSVRAEDFNFSEKGVQEVQRKNIGRLHNVLSFYELFANEAKHAATDASTHILDRYILERLAETTSTITKSLDAYELDRASRPIADFIDDLSTWYIRRSRDRVKGSDSADKAAALGTTKHVLQETAKLIAPFMPFYAEYLYKQVCADQDSVHLESWPIHEPKDETCTLDMKKLRDLVTLGLEARDRAGVKVRQPLASVQVPKQNFADKEALMDILKDELNVKAIVESDIESVEVDTEMTEELIAEGQYRDLLRRVQELRKKEGLAPSDQVTLKVDTDESGKKVIDAFRSDLLATAGISELDFEEIEGGETIEIKPLRFVLLIER